MLGKLFGRAGKDKVAPVATAFGTHIYDPVGHFDDVVVVLDDDNGMPAGDEAVERFDEFLNVMEMKSGRRFVEDEKFGSVGSSFDEIGGEFDTLRLTAAERTGGLSQLEIAQPYVLQRLETVENGGLAFEKFNCLVDCHVEHFGDILAIVQHFEGFFFETGSMAFLTY